MSNTPRVDAIITGNSDVTNEEYEDLAYLARALERENAAMREAIREAASAFKMLSDVEPKTFAEQLSVMAVCHVEFTKLQPFLKP